MKNKSVNSTQKSSTQNKPSGLKDGDKDWHTPCQNCDQVPTVHPIQLCGPCCFGEAETYGGNL